MPEQKRERTWCAFCGDKLQRRGHDPHKFCVPCDTWHYSNPGPVSLAIVPVFEENPREFGLFGITRGDPKSEGHGKKAFPGGYHHSGETSQHAAARELEEETGVILNPATFALFGSVYAPEPDVHMTLWLTPHVRLSQIRSVFKPNIEASDIHAWYVVPKNMAFDTHAGIARRFFSLTFDDLERMRTLMGGA